MGEAAGENTPLIPIEKLLFDGQTVLVQVIKDPIGTKGARLSTQISIAGRMLVFLPQDTHIGISQRIENEENREALRDRVQRLVDPNESGGFIVRTIAEDASEQELKMDVDYLRKTWATISEQMKRLPPTSLLYQDLNLAQRVLRDFVSVDTERIQIDSRESFQKLLEFAANFTPSVMPKLVHYTGERPLFDWYGVEEEIERALGRRVDLKSGGYLIIEQTEAMSTIDVNTGSFVAGRNLADTIFKTNLEAAQAIARQLRLRNLGGMIILDLIDMDNAVHQEAVLAELNKAFARDRTKISASGFSALGLVEVTRKRTRESLAHILCETCPACSGKGQVKTARTVCYEILRELLREAKQFNPREFRILASQVVIDLFLEEESQHLALLGDFIGKPISLQVESTYHQEQYDVILM
jgi:ribonuclease G